MSKESENLYTSVDYSIDEMNDEVFDEEEEDEIQLKYEN
jgi:hypothetical protein